MKIVLRSLVVSFVALIITAAAALADDISALTAVFDTYCAAAKAGDFEKVMSMYSVDEQSLKREQNAQKEARDYFLLQARVLVPDSYKVQHVNWDKDRNGVTFHILGDFPAMKEPEVERPQSHLRESIALKKEKGTWKIDLILNWGDPAEVKRITDLAYDPKDVNKETTVTVGGRIVRVDYKTEYTLVLVEARGEEELVVFLPPKKVLIASEDVLQWIGEPLEQLVPWKMFEFESYPARSSESKYFGIRGRWIGN